MLEIQQRKLAVIAGAFSGHRLTVEEQRRENLKNVLLAFDLGDEAEAVGAGAVALGMPAAANPAAPLQPLAGPSRANRRRPRPSTDDEDDDIVEVVEERPTPRRRAAAAAAVKIGRFASATAEDIYEPAPTPTRRRVIDLTIEPVASPSRDLIKRRRAIIDSDDEYYLPPPEEP